MKKEILFFTIVAMIFYTSCSTTKTSTSKTMDIYGPGVIHKPVLVDLEVKETKVTGTATFSQGSSLETVKNEAVSNVLKTAGADVLVEPIFTTKTSGGSITATVTGFPATYKNFRPIKAEDVPLLSVGITQKANVYESPATSITKPKKAALIILGILAIAAGTVLTITKGN